MDGDKFGDPFIIVDAATKWKRRLGKPRRSIVMDNATNVYPNAEGQKYTGVDDFGPQQGGYRRSRRSRRKSRRSRRKSRG